MADFGKIMEFSMVKRIPSPFEIGKNFIKYNWILPLFNRPFLPRAMCIYVTYKCNSRCRMCGIWKQNAKYEGNELSIRELERIFSDPLFSGLEYININGGEPNLRKDLIEIVELFIDKFPHLNTITLNSNGLPPGKTIENVEMISGLCQRNNIRFSVSLSLHKIGEGYDKIAGVKDAYSNVKRAFDGLKEINRDKRFYISANCVITNLNIYSLEEMLEWGKNEQIPVNFTLGEIRDRFHNFEMSEKIRIKEKDKEFIVSFFRNLANQKSIFFQHSLRYAHLADIIEFGRKRTLACHYSMGGVILGSDGSLYYCKDSKAIGSCRERSPLEIYFDKNNLRYRNNSLIRDKCYRCPPNTFNKMEVEKNLFKFIRYYFLSR